MFQVLPSRESTEQFLRSMAEHRRGRKRLLDTQLAATYFCAGIRAIVTTNARDYGVFGCFDHPTEPTGSATSASPWWNSLTIS